MLRQQELPEGVPPGVPREEDGTFREVGMSTPLLCVVQQEGRHILQHLPDFLLLPAPKEAQVNGSGRSTEV